jgi:protein-tyrosine phosphatase
MLDEGCVHILASDGHHPQRRPPVLAKGRDAAAARVGDLEATHLVTTRPQGVVENRDPADLPPLPQARPKPGWADGLWKRMIGAQ